MNTHYEQTLYPLQDRILAAIDSTETIFYLTGGTALSRFFYPYRYSDDLDLFVNSYDNFVDEVERVVLTLGQFHITAATKTNTYYSLIVGGMLKIDFVNDTGQYPDTFFTSPVYSKIDMPERILANKLSALLGRDDPKDVVDIWIIASHKTIDWRSMFTDISSRAAGVFPPLIAEKIATFPLELLETIKWVEGKRPSSQKMREDLATIADAIIRTDDAY